MEQNNQWLNWLKCNVLELVTLVLVLVLLVGFFSASAVKETPTVAAVAVEEPLAVEGAAEAPAAEVPAEEGAEETPAE